MIDERITNIASGSPGVSRRSAHAAALERKTRARFSGVSSAISRGGVDHAMDRAGRGAHGPARRRDLGRGQPDAPGAGMDRHPLARARRRSAPSSRS
jgi:hypothetical protein